MALIQMSCPNTHAKVATGQHMTPADFAAADILGGRFRCSACQKVHEWTKGDVTLTEWRGSPP